MFSELSQLYSLWKKYGQYLPLIVKVVQDVEAEAAVNSTANLSNIATDLVAGIGAIDPSFPTGDVVDIQADIVKLFDDIRAKKSLVQTTGSTAPTA